MEGWKEQNLEYRTLIRCNSSLITLLSPNVLRLAELLLSELIIPESTRTFVRDGNCLDDRKTSRLVEVVQKKVGKHPHLFYKFVDVIDLELSQQDVVSDLRETLESMKRENCVDVDKTSHRLSPLSDSDNEHVQTTKDAIAKLKSEFKKMAKSMKNLLIEKDHQNELKFRYFKEDFIYDLPESTRDQIQFYLEKKSDNIGRAKTYDNLFMALHHCWDYLNPYLLQHIVHEYGETLKDDMNLYIRYLEEFRSITNVGSFLEAQDSVKLREPPPQFHEVITQHALCNECTLQCIEEIRLDLCQEIGLHSFALFIAKVARGSLIITWFVTAKVAKMLVDMGKEQDGSFRVLSTKAPEATELLTAAVLDEGSKLATGGKELIAAVSDEGEVSNGASLEELEKCTSGISLHDGASKEESVKDGASKEELEKDTGILLYPSEVRDVVEIYLPAADSAADFHEVSFGRWLVREPLYNLTKTWQRIKQEMEGNKLSTTGLKSSTGRYNPSSTGPGPVTYGMISVYTTEENIDTTGWQLMSLVEHDIVYKTKEATDSGKRRHKGDRGFIPKKFFWNNGKPTAHLKNSRTAVWKQGKNDKWHLNVALSPDSSALKEEQVGYWLVNCETENLTDLWYVMREAVEHGLLGPVKMNCPSPANKRGGKTTPVLMLYTIARNRESVGSALRDTKLAKSLSYVTLRGTQAREASCGTPVCGDISASGETLVKVPSIDR